jgi:hypothetical protein
MQCDWFPQGFSPPGHGMCRPDPDPQCHRTLTFMVDLYPLRMPDRAAILPSTGILSRYEER